MPTTDENKAARTEHSREVAKYAADAYRDAVTALFDAMESNRAMMIDLDLDPLPKVAYEKYRRELREQAKQLVRQGRDLGIERTKMAEALGVSRQTIHEWINEGET